MPHPEGYRKALRLMMMAARFGRPVITLIDTPGAYPGIGAEERGQAEAIARNLREMARMRVPVIAAVIGEGGSGGALALGVADRVLMFENSIYSVISPEGCAAILWKTASAKDRAAEALRLTADDLAALRVIDEVLPEPVGGAHHDWDAAAGTLREALLRHLAALRGMPPGDLLDQRWTKYESMGEWRVVEPVPGDSEEPGE
jgi:acetyl-CoA carboxylase carboxyl transferase subunit alpha